MLASIKKLMDQMLSDLAGEQPEVYNIMTEVQALSYNLYVLTLSRRECDMPHCSGRSMDQNLLTMTTLNLLFRDIDSNVEADKKTQADLQIQDFILSKRFKCDSHY